MRAKGISDKVFEKMYKTYRPIITNNWFDTFLEDRSNSSFFHFLGILQDVKVALNRSLKGYAS